MDTTIRIWLRDRATMLRLTEITDSAESVTMGDVLSAGTGSFSCTLSLSASLEMLVRTHDLMVEMAQYNPRTEQWHDIWAGPVVLKDYDVSDELPTCFLSAVSPWIWAGARYMAKATEEVVDEVESFTERSASELAGKIIRDTNQLDGPTWLRALPTEQYPAPNVWIDNYASWKRVSDQIDELSNSNPGIDWRLKYGYGVDSQGNYIARFTSAGTGTFPGSDKTGSVVFTYGRTGDNVMQSRTTEDMTGLANRVTHVESGAKPYTVTVPAEPYSTSIQRYGVWDDVISDDVPSPLLKKRLAQEHVAWRGGPHTTISFTPIPNAGELSDLIPFVDYNVGDTVQYREYSKFTGELLLAGVVKIYEINLRLEEGKTPVVDLVVSQQG
jgi:hypothetical protein